MKKELHIKIVDKIFRNLGEYHGFGWFERAREDIRKEILAESYRSVKCLLDNNKNEFQPKKRQN